MSTPPLRVSRDDYNDVRSSIENAISLGGDIRGILESQKELNPTNDLHNEVCRAGEALSVFGSRWTIEILSALYIAGPRRFNQMKNLLEEFLLEHFPINCAISPMKDWFTDKSLKVHQYECPTASPNTVERVAVCFRRLWPI